MKKSELFQTIYKSIHTARKTIGEEYEQSTYQAEMGSEAEDLKIDKKTAAYIKEALLWESEKLEYECAVAMTDLIAGCWKVEDDVDLHKLENVERLTLEVEE